MKLNGQDPKKNKREQNNRSYYEQDDYDAYDNDYSSGSSSFIRRMIVFLVVFTVLLIGIVLYLNRQQLSGSTGTQALATGSSTEAATDSEEALAGRDTRTAQDLDIWNMYPQETKASGENDGMPAGQESQTQTANDPATDGHHTEVTKRDGTTQWLTINNYLPKNELDVTNLVRQKNVMKYYKNDKLVSYMGVDVSKDNSYVDYQALKNAGVQFVMIRVGARGYASGNITLDEYFADNIKQASDAGLDIGLTFFSQAINAEEAKAEAQTVLDQIGTYTISYPIAIDMEYIENDKSRIETTTPEQKTTILKTFCTAIRDAGYNPMIYGNKEWLLQEINLTKLTDEDIWLSQTGDSPDYPYRFSMWQYGTNETIDGISGGARLDMSLIDFSLK